MDYLLTINNLLKEAFSLVNYKKLPILFRVLCAIVVLPFAVIFMVVVGFYYLFAVAYKCLKSPAEHLLSFVKDVGNDVKHATQFIVYFFGFPIIFLINVLLSVFICVLFILNLLINITGYTATLGGITFAPFLFEHKDRNVAETKSMGNVAIIIFSIIGLVLVALHYIFVLGSFGVITFYFYEDILPFYYGSIAYYLFTAIYIFVACHKK